MQSTIQIWYILRLLFSAMQKGLYPLLQHLGIDRL